MSLEIITYKSPKSPIAESYRTLRTNLQFTSAGKELKTILITSSMPGEGKSWTSSNLAVAFAQSGKKVLLIDADMRKGRQHKIFGLRKDNGLSNYLSGVGSHLLERDSNINDEDLLISMFNKTEVTNLFVMTSGNVPPNPSELLQSNRMQNMVSQLKEVFDIVIFDGPPCNVVTDGLILSRMVDSVAIVASYKETKTELLKNTVKGLKNVNAKIAGIILNKVPNRNNSYYSYK